MATERVSAPFTTCEMIGEEIMLAIAEKLMPAVQIETGTSVHNQSCLKWHSLPEVAPNEHN
jgi:hypothetical protein